MSRKTKALKTWKDAFESFHHVMPLEIAISRAAAELKSKMGIELRCKEDRQRAIVTVSAMAPSGLTFDAECVGYRTTTIELRLTEQVLSTFMAKDLWR